MQQKSALAKIRKNWVIYAHFYNALEKFSAKWCLGAGHSFHCTRNLTSLSGLFAQFKRQKWHANKRILRVNG